MCDPATAAAIIAAVSSTAKAVNNNQALRAQDRAAAEGIRRQGALQASANKRVGEQITDIQGSTGASERADSLEGFLNAIRDSRESTEGALDPVGGANPRFAENVAGGKRRIATAGVEQSGRLSRIDAPRFQRQAEGARIGRTASDVSEFGRQSTAEDFLTRLRVAGKRPNALVDVLATVGQGVSSAIALGSGGGFLDKLFGRGSPSDLFAPFDPLKPLEAIRLPSG